MDDMAITSGKKERGKVTLESVLLFLGGGVGVAIISGIVTIIRARMGAKQGEPKLRADITDQITELASEWLEKATERLKAVEDENKTLRSKVETLEAAAKIELQQRQQMIDHVAAVHSWIERGAKPPPPARPVWAPGTMILGTLVDNEIPDRNLG